MTQGNLRLVSGILTAIVLAGLSAASPALGQEEPGLFVCGAGENAFTVEERAPFRAAAASAGNPGTCADLEGTEGVTTRVALVTGVTAAALESGDRSRFQSAGPAIEIRLGDPIVLNGRPITVRKYFGDVMPESNLAPYTSRALIEISAGLVAAFELRAPTRDSHDRHYQAWRNLVRTYRPLPQSPSTH